MQVESGVWFVEQGEIGGFLLGVEHRGKFGSDFIETPGEIEFTLSLSASGCRVSELFSEGTTTVSSTPLVLVPSLTLALSSPSSVSLHVPSEPLLIAASTT